MIMKNVEKFIFVFEIIYGIYLFVLTYRYNKKHKEAEQDCKQLMKSWAANKIEKERDQLSQDDLHYLYSIINDVY